MKKTKQRIEEITYPMAKESTTVGGVLKRLRLTKGWAMHKQIKEGKITVNGRVPQNSYQRVSANDVIGWFEYRITLKNDEAAKAARLAQELMRSGGMRGGPFSTGHAGGGMAGAGGGK